jgi:hypothetical protein
MTITINGTTGITDANGGTVLNTQSQITSTVAVSGTSVSFTGLSADAKCFNLGFDGISLSGTNNMLIQFGTSSGYIATGYSTGVGYIVINSGTSGYNATTGFPLYSGSAALSWYGNVEIKRISPTVLGISGGIFTFPGTALGTVVYPLGALIVSSGAVIDRVQLITTGSNTFDSGSLSLAQSFG